MTYDRNGRKEFFGKIHNNCVKVHFIFPIKYKKMQIILISERLFRKKRLSLHRI